MAQQPVVSIFGGSSPRPGTPAYTEAEELGRLLAEAGFAIMTGGYAGTMEAASRGAHLAGGRVIGVTVGLFERQWNSRPNAYVDEVVHFDSLSERLHYLVTQSAAAVAVRGGIGTLSEVALTWSLLQVGEISPRPLVLLGEIWPDVLGRLYGDGAYIRPEHMQLWQAAYTPAEAVNLIRRGVA